MKMEKRTFRIGELAHHLELQQFVIRFWEKEFNFKSHRSQGGQRYYTETDLQRFERIKEMLYNQGLTITGAKKQLLEQDQMYLSSQPTTFKIQEATTVEEPRTEEALTTELCHEKPETSIVETTSCEAASEVMRDAVEVTEHKSIMETEVFEEQSATQEAAPCTVVCDTNACDLMTEAQAESAIQNTVEAEVQPTIYSDEQLKAHLLAIKDKLQKIQTML